MSLLFRSIDAMPRHGGMPAIVQLNQEGAAPDVVSYDMLHRAAASIAHVVGRHAEEADMIGLVAANSAAWIKADLALLMGRYVSVPVPLGFSAEQAAHLLSSCRLILVDARGRAQMQKWIADATWGCPAIEWIDIESATGHAVEAPTLDDGSGEDRVCKVIHTSGTTNKPKGVRIRAQALETLVESLRALTQPGDYARYLNLVPFSLLIEQVTALYLPYTQQGCVLLAPPGQPLLGEPGVSLADKIRLMGRAVPSAMTLTPAMVEALDAAVRATARTDVSTVCLALFGRPTPPLLAAGGAPVSESTQASLARRGIDVLVGYGLSENSSVACWNTRASNRIGTVGKPLPHVECRLSDDGELGIRSRSAFAGYLGSDPSACALDDDGWLWTGDLASIDGDGFVRITGRKKNLIITSHGRNVAPEFVEASYRQVRGVREIVILGDRREALSAFVLAEKGCDGQDLIARLKAFGRARLSEVEQVEDLICLPESEELLSTLFTVTGRPRREHIERYVQALRGSILTTEEA